MLPQTHSSSVQHSPQVKKKNEPIRLLFCNGTKTHNAQASHVNVTLIALLQALEAGQLVFHFLQDQQKFRQCGFSYLILAKKPKHVERKVE